MGKDDSEYTLNLAKDAKFTTCELGIRELCHVQVRFDLLLTLWEVGVSQERFRQATGDWTPNNSAVPLSCLS